MVIWKNLNADVEIFGVEQLTVLADRMHFVLFSNCDSLNQYFYSIFIYSHNQHFQRIWRHLLEAKG
jgi:hypothetical protein